MVEGKEDKKYSLKIGLFKGLKILAVVMGILKADQIRTEQIQGVFDLLNLHDIGLASASGLLMMALNYAKTKGIIKF